MLIKVIIARASDESRGRASATKGTHEGLAVREYNIVYDEREGHQVQPCDAEREQVTILAM